MSFQTAARGRLTSRRAPVVQHWVGSAGGACAPPLVGAAPVDAGVDAGVGDGVLAAVAVAFGGATTALRFVPSTTLPSASTTDLSSTSLPTMPPRTMGRVTANATANRPSTTRAGERGALTSRAE